MCFAPFGGDLLRSNTHQKIASNQNSHQSHRYHRLHPGLTNGSKNNKHFTDPPYHLDPYSTAYLQTHPELQHQVAAKLTYTDETLKARLNSLTNTEEFIIYSHFAIKYFLLDAHKFGGLFLAYEQDYERHHAKYLIFKGPLNLNHMSRLAAACKKEGLLAEVAPEGTVRITAI